MKITPELVLIFIHLFLLLVYAIFIILGKSHLSKEQIVLMCLVPIVGILVALTIEYLIIFKKQGQKSPDMERLTLDDEILWTTLRSFEEKGDLVPLEEAVLIDEVKVRRRSMLETLYADPFKYLDVLNVAKYNEDIETSHYATTTISKAQKDFQLAIQKHATQVEHYPDDQDALDTYLEILQKYIRSGLLEEHLLRNLRIVYSKALDRKLAMIMDDKNALIEKVRNAVELKDYASALDTSLLLKTYWCQDEQTWIEALRVCVDGNDRIQLQKTIKEIQHTDIIWTDQGREQVSPWMKLAAK